ncbi:probable xyloglucan endotransglucosylase/hydrolase protein 33 [Impatiens glandulifera]|uniref:probable xyloglucan endotransglucosylase/hydrolase protein 33 n=1 Tax=Impatiens glandulifera TaxID=253017 RepID=UPI001FB19C4A|nr:probable xyloglucan endotransglucosylase/hydrolase protein 33 [Impatiens glandulifera]
MFIELAGMVPFVQSKGPIYVPPNVPKLTQRFPHAAVVQAYDNLYGQQNIHLLNNGSNVDLVLDKKSGAGLVSRNKYNYGFFSAAMKLPSGFTSGIVIAFYLSNSDVFPHDHDEIDIELLGHEKRREWVLQTNIYGNGSVHTGREEKLYLWFDPTTDFHEYSILWNNHHIVFLVDNVPVREFTNNVASSPVYPIRPMSMYATIWDASEWATKGGKYPVNYQYAPFVASFGKIELEGCQWNPDELCSKRALSSLEPDPVGGEEFAKLSQEQVNGMDWARKKLMFYSYCQDTTRYKLLPPECKS